MDGRAADPETLFGGYAGRILVLVTVGMMTSFGGLLMLSPLLPEIIDRLAITPSKAGLALSLMWVLNAVFQYPGGRLADQLSHKTILVAALAVLIAGFGTLVVSTTYGLFLVAVALVGVGAGLYSPASMVQLSALFTRRRSQAIGVNTAAVHLGGALAAVVAVIALSRVSWRFAYLPVVAVLVVVTVSLHAVSTETYDVDRVSLDLGAIGRQLVGTGHLRLLILSFSLLEIVWQGATSFLPALLIVDKGTSSLFASGAFAGLFLVGGVTNPIVGRLGDRFGNLVTGTAVTVVGLVGLGVLLAATTAPGIAAGVFLFAIGLTGFWPVMITHCMNYFSDENRGGSYGALSTVFIGVGAVGPAYAGFVAERFDYTTAFTGLGVCFAATLVIVVWLTKIRKDSAFGA